MALVTWEGNGNASLTTAQGDDNWDILNGRNLSIVATPLTVSILHESMTLELSVADSVVNLPTLPMASQDGQISDFKVTLKNIHATVATVNTDAAESFDDGTTAITLAQYEYITIQSDSTGNKWNVINRGNYGSRDNTFTGANTFNGVTTFNALTTINQGAPVASAAALPVLTDGNYFDVTGTAAITSINTVGVGSVIKLHFDDALTLTYHATNLILPGGGDYTTVAGDEAEFFEYATGQWICTNYSPVGGGPSISRLSTATEGDTYYLNSTGVFTRLGIGTANQVLQTNTGATAPEWRSAGPIYLGEITGGTTGQELGELTGIAATTNVITLLFKGVSVDTNNKTMQIEIGDSTGYAAVSEGTVGALTGGAYYSDGWTGGPAYVRGQQGAGGNRGFSGTITLTKQDSANVWTVSGNIGYGTVSDIAFTGGHIDNAAEVVDRIKITCVSAANFNGGSVQVFESK